LEKEKLIIRNFGPIKNVELELGRFNVLIGEQATGKTLIGKVLSCCRYFSYIVSYSDFKEAFENWGLTESIKDDTLIEYTSSDYKLKIQFEKHLLPNGVSIIDNEKERNHELKLTCNLTPVTKNFKSLFKEYNDFLKKDDNWIPYKIKAPVSFFQNQVASIIDNPFFIPTERSLQSIFSLGKSSIQNINDALFNQFAKVDQIQRYFKTETDIEPLGIEYKNVNGYGLFRKKGSADWLRMDNAPSGYKTTVPIVLILKYYSQIKLKKKTFIIDEPEISLFPATQKEVVSFITDRIFNSKDKNNGYNFENSVLITTHSPYILTSLNNLMYAFQIGKEHKEEVAKIIEEKYWVNPKEVSAYQLLADGTSESIIAEDGLIMAEKIDLVSSVINSEYDKIQDIELLIENTEAND